MDRLELSCGTASVGGIWSSRRRAPRFWGITRLPHHVISQAGALFVMDDTRWDHGLTVTGEGQGLVGHAGALLLRKLADQAGLTAALGSALARKGGGFRWWMPLDQCWCQQADRNRIGQVTDRRIAIGQA